MGNYDKAISIYKKSMKECSQMNDFLGRMFTCKSIAETYYEVMCYDKAINYVKKLLRMSWQWKSDEYEIIAYDLLGKYYIMKGNVDMGYYFHSRAMGNVLEGKNSMIKILCDIFFFLYFNSFFFSKKKGKNQLRK